MRPFEIYYAKVLWGGCFDERPWLIVQLLPGGFLGCFPISGQCYSNSCFYLDSTHPGFPATGLTKSCFIHDSHIIRLSNDQLLRRRGRFAGSTFDRFSELCWRLRNTYARFPRKTASSGRALAPQFDVPARPAKKRMGHPLTPWQ